MRTLRLMADYECFPLWEAGDAVGNVDPWSLDIPGELAAALSTWGDEYTATLNQEDPTASGFADEPTAPAWVLAGARLADRLRDEGVAVQYFEDGWPSKGLVAGAE